MSLLHRSQLSPLCTPSTQIHIPANARTEVILASTLARFSTLVLGGAERNTLDSAINLVECAESVAKRGHPERTLFVQLSNRRGLNWHADRVVFGPHAKRVGDLLASFAPDDDFNADVNNWTNVPSKSATMNGLLTLPDVVSRMRVLHVFDRNTNVLDVDAVLRDYDRMWTTPETTILVPLRDTSNAIEAIGRQNQAIEEGHGAALLGLPDKIGTGWANLAGVYFWDALLALADPTHPVLPLSRAACKLPASGGRSDVGRYFGLAGFSPNGLGQSEDLWSVFQQTHNLIGLGGRPEFGVTDSAALKLREKRSAFAVSNAGTRWARGLVDSLRSPIHQMISFFGPESILERKARRSAERVYLSAPIGVLGMALLFVGITTDANPFVGIQMVMWTIAICLSQSMTLHGLVASMRAKGARYGPQILLLTVGAMAACG
jgi:hypothetical protein